MVCKYFGRAAVEQIHDCNRLGNVISGYVSGPGNRVRRTLIDTGATPMKFRMSRKVPHVYY
jgi:hypothetical protein